MLKYVSIDLETTSLDPKRGQILEIAAVYDNDPNVLVEDLPHFTSLVRADSIRGDLAALVMNSEILYDIQMGAQPMNYIDAVSQAFGSWLKSFPELDGSFYAAGKNFATFDGPWLREHLTIPIRWKHRVLDLGSMYLTCDDDDIPNLGVCMKRSGVFAEDHLSVKHRALADARDVVRCVRAYFL